PVEVRRDEWGVPQLYADTAHDLFLAQGYIHAQDRFFEMDFRRHLTSGRLSEWFGESQIQTDKFIRTLGFRETAEQEFNELDPRTQNYLRAYADGVNAYLEGRTGSEISVEYTGGLLGPDEEVRPWEPADSVAWLKAMAWDLRGNLDAEIDRVLASTKVPAERVEELYPSYPFERHDPSAPDAGGKGGRQNGEDGGSREDEANEDGEDESGAAGAAEGRAAADPAARLPKDAVKTLTELDRLLADLPDVFGTGEGDLSGIGSNAWVVGGEHTKSGK